MLEYTNFNTKNKIIDIFDTIIIDYSIPIHSTKCY